MMKINFGKEFLNPKIFIFWILGVVIFIVIVVSFEKNKSNEFPTLQNKDSLDAEIINFSLRGNSMYVVLIDQRKIFINASQNREYKDNFNLSSMISVGDRIIKKPYSDTLILEHLGEKYFFIHDEAIGW
jgi:hypothetical protein